MSEFIDTRSLPVDNPEREKQGEQKESERYLKLARGNPHTLTEEINKNPKTESLLRKILGDTEYERIRDLNPIKLSEDERITKIQKEIYIFMDIDPETDRNGTKEKFIKGIIDSIIIDNSELAMKIIETKGVVLKDMLAQIFSWEGLKQIAEGLKTSVMGIFSGDAYKTGKSLGELGLITVGSGAGGFVLKRVGKGAIQVGKQIVINAGKDNIFSQGFQTGGRVIEGAGKIVQAPYNAVEMGAKKVGGAIQDGMKTGSKVIGGIPQLQKVTEPAIRVVSEGMEKLSDGTKKIIITTKERAKEVLAIASVPILVGSKDGVEVSSRLKGQIGAIGDISGKETKPNESSTGAYESYNNIRKPKILYDHSDYTFLVGDEYKGLRELFPNLSEKDIIGEGLNGIILKHPDQNKVIKIAKPKGDNLEREFLNQKGFIDALEDLKSQLSSTSDYEIIRRFQIPEITKFRGIKGIYEMEKVHGINFKTLATIKYHQEALKDLPLRKHGKILTKSLKKECRCTLFSYNIHILP